MNFKVPVFISLIPVAFETTWVLATLIHTNHIVIYVHGSSSVLSIKVLFTCFAASRYHASSTKMSRIKY